MNVAGQLGVVQAGSKLGACLGGGRAAGENLKCKGRRFWRSAVAVRVCEGSIGCIFRKM